MKKAFAALCLLTITSLAFAQTAQDSVPKKRNRHELTAEQKANRALIEKRIARIGVDRFQLDLLGTNWIHDGANGFKTKWYSRGMNIYFSWGFRIKKSRFSFAPGIGWGCSNIYHRSELVKDDSLGGLKFTPMEQTKLDQIKTNKITLQYIDIPLELRWHSKPDKLDNLWKIAIGFKAGIRIDSHTKQKIKTATETKVYVERRFPDFNLFRMGPTIRIGYSVVNITAYYGILGVFKTDKGPKANEFAVGISFSGL